MKQYKKHLQNIITANNDNRLAIFIGAGVSKCCETDYLKLPNWKSLIADLQEELDITESDYLKLAQLYFLEFGEHTYYKKLKDYFPSYIRPSEVHKLIFEISPNIIITTNWDNILEKTIEENAYIYDIICNDTDLVKSQLPQKLIKMHGDFKNHNLVFKEDDYINYQYNFPLIENYLKSILSTHTVLFIGYSYNDYNLKQIIKWIQNYSTVRPPMYLTTFNEKKTLNKYFESHGIKTLLINDLTYKLDSLNETSNKLYCFLYSIKNYEENISANSDIEIVKAIYNKLKLFTDLESILFEQIENALVYCSIIYSDKGAILQLNYEEYFSGFDKSAIRKLYHNFVNILKKIDSKEKEPFPELLQVFQILVKANFIGVAISGMNFKKVEYIEITEFITPTNKKNDFSIFDKVSNKQTTLLEIIRLAFSYYQIGEYKKSFTKTEEAILIAIKSRNYTSLFILMFNRNVLLKYLKVYSDKNEEYLKMKEYDIEEKFFSLPKDIREVVKPILNSFNGSYIFKYAYSTAQELKKTEKNKSFIDSGGIILNSNYTRPKIKHLNFVSFILKNKIMIENKEEYKDINFYYVKINILKQTFSKETHLDRLNIFSIVKYINFEDVKKLFNDFYNKNIEKRKKLTIDNDDKEWLLTQLNDLTTKYISCENKSRNKFEKPLKNTLFLLSLIHLQKNQLTDIVNNITRLINKGNNFYDIYECINLFFGIQYNVYNQNIDKKILLNLIETLIKKICQRKAFGIELSAIQNAIPNLFGYVQISKGIFDKALLVDNLIEEIKTFSFSDKIHKGTDILLHIYGISNEEIRYKIKNYLLGIKSDNFSNDEDKISFKLKCAVFNFEKLNQDIIDLIKNYIKKYTGKSFSSLLYDFEAKINYIIQENSKEYTNSQINQLKTIHSDLKRIIGVYEEVRTSQVF